MTKTLNARPSAGLAGLLSSLALAIAPAAHAEGGARTLTYHLDLNQPQSRLALLTRIEDAARDYCDQPMTRSDRQACARKATEAFIRNTSDAVREALTLAQNERAASQLASR